MITGRKTSFTVNGHLIVVFMNLSFKYSVRVNLMLPSITGMHILSHYKWKIKKGQRGPGEAHGGYNTRDEGTSSKSALSRRLSSSTLDVIVNLFPKKCTCNKSKNIPLFYPFVPSCPDHSSRKLITIFLKQKQNVTLWSHF